LLYSNIEKNSQFIEGACGTNIHFFRWKMRIGDSNHLSKTVNTLFLEIKGVFIHPNYNGNSSYFDIAIVETANVMFSYFISPICLPRSVYTFTLLDFWLNSILFD
jgi:hypothetical protein